MVNSNNTLHLLAAPPKHWQAVLAEMNAMWQTGDQLLLIAEGAAGLNAPELSRFNTVALLASDATALNLREQDLPERIQRITQATWAEWTLYYPRTITWR